MKHIFLMNHTKRHHDFETIIKDVMKDQDYELIYTNSMLDTQNYMKQYSGQARFYAVGGDGTVSGIIQPLVHTEHELVVIPLGTGNDFCRMLTKEKNPKTILMNSLTKKAQKIDVVQLNDIYYINSTCFGVDSVIANHVHDTPNIPLVPDSKSYIVSIMQNVFRYHFDKVTFISEGKCLYQGQVTLCTLNNGQYYGGGFQITPQANLQDGYMDVCIVDKVPKAKIPYLLSFLMRHVLERRKEVHYFKVKAAQIICENDSNVDGEEYKSKEYHFQVVPTSLNLVI